LTQPVRPACPRTKTQVMNPGGPPNEQELYTFRALAEQAQDPNFDVAQVMHHLQANMAAMNQLQQQFGNLQNLVQEQSQQSNQASSTPAPITSLHAAVEALANSHLEQQQMQQNFQTNVQHILDRLAQRSAGTSRVPIPQPLSTKFKGDDNELSYSDFKAKLQTAFARSPDSLTSDSWQHAGYLTAMLGFIDEDATRSVATFDILSPSERRLVLGTWNETSEAYSDHLVHHLIEHGTACQSV
ncbi:hypothetical protein BGX31_009992, partial [Mortierella sp. GBA43]